MRRSPLMIVAASALVVLSLAEPSRAGDGSLRGWLSRRQAQRMPWHGDYYHAAWGIPVAQVVPPVAEYQTHWGWGVGNYRVTPIRHQFNPYWPGSGYYSRRMFKPTPPWPSDTDQFGVYYVRGPW